MSTAKAGKLLLVDTGIYSDYSVIGFFVVLRDFDPKAELDEWLALNPKQREEYEFSYDKFLGALLSKGLLLEADFSTLHLGDYCTASGVEFYPFEVSADVAQVA